ncbi:MAG: hypothetical protein Q8R36_03770 [bacterium]|nr:hypothetical protein [bacterium]
MSLPLHPLKDTNNFSSPHLNLVWGYWSLCIIFIGFAIGVVAGHITFPIKTVATKTINQPKNFTNTERGIIESANRDEKFLILVYKSVLDPHTRKRIKIYFDEKTEVIEELKRGLDIFNFENISPGDYTTIHYTRGEEDRFYALEIYHHKINPLAPYLIQ